MSRRPRVSFVVVLETGFLCSFGAYPGTRSIDQTGLELTEICLSENPECQTPDSEILAPKSMSSLSGSCSVPLDQNP